jgi:exonuclease III
VSKTPQTAAELAQAAFDAFVASATPTYDDDRLVIASFNIWRESTANGVYTDLQELIAKTDADVICLQEGKNWIDEISADYGDDWHLRIDHDGISNAKGVPIMLRKGRFDEITSFRKFGCDQTAGTPERYIQTVRCTHLASGRRLQISNTHMNSHVQGGTEPHDLPRLQAYYDHMERNFDVVKNAPEDALVFFTGDWNVDYRLPWVRQHNRWPIRTFGRAGLRANWSYGDLPDSGTHDGGKRIIDHIYHQHGGPVTFVNDRIFRKMASDHNAVVAYYKVKRLAAAA